MTEITCELHGAPAPCGECTAWEADHLAYLRGQSRIAGLLAERVKAAEAAVKVLGDYARYEAAGDMWEIGSVELADAITGAETAATALRGVRRIAGLYAAGVKADLAEAERETAP
jgi:hypothetical protein